MVCGYLDESIVSPKNTKKGIGFRCKIINIKIDRVPTTLGIGYSLKPNRSSEPGGFYSFIKLYSIVLINVSLLNFVIGNFIFLIHQMDTIMTLFLVAFSA